MQLSKCTSFLCVLSTLLFISQPVCSIFGPLYSDFMDYDPSSGTPMGSDGCFDGDADENNGLETIWCDTCPLTVLYNELYSTVLSKADFWILAANAVIKHTSPDNNVLDLKSTFQWGRVDAVSCVGSAVRLPGASGCSEVERVLMDRLGMSWTDAVALIGAHTLGRGNRDFSGHHGIWDVTEEDSMVSFVYDYLFSHL